jgi:hypothetical protein
MRDEMKIVLLGAVFFVGSLLIAATAVVMSAPC